MSNLHRVGGHRTGRALLAALSSASETRRNWWTRPFALPPGLARKGVTPLA